MSIYQNNEVEITYEIMPPMEAKINVNGENLIWISIVDIDEFKNDLSEVLDKYRI